MDSREYHLNWGFHHHPFESPAKLISVSNRSADECPAGHVPRIYCCPGEEQIDAHMCLPTWTCFPFGPALLGHNDQTWGRVKVHTVERSIKASSTHPTCAQIWPLSQLVEGHKCKLSRKQAHNCNVNVCMCVCAQVGCVELALMLRSTVCTL
jgi:hypothetical protein